MDLICSEHHVFMLTLRLTETALKSFSTW